MRQKRVAVINLDLPKSMHFMSGDYLVPTGHVRSLGARFRCQLVDESDVSEGSSGHDVIITTSRAV